MHYVRAEDATKHSRSKLPHPDDPRWLIKTLLSQRPWSFISALLMALTFLTNGLIPLILGQAIDDAVATSDVRRLLLWIGVIVGVFILQIICAWFGRLLMVQVDTRLGHELRMAVTDRIQDPRGMGGRSRTAGDLLSIASNDTTRVSQSIMITIFPVAEVASIIYVGVVLLWIHIPLGLAVLIGGPIVVYSALLAARPLRSKATARQAAMGEVAATATDVVQGLRILKGLGAVVPVRNRYQLSSTEAYERTVEANAAEARLNAISESVGGIYVIGVGIAATMLAIQGTLSVGELITVVGLTQFVITPMTMMGRNIASIWATAQASASRITDVLTTPFDRPAETRAVPTTPTGLTVVAGPAPADLELLPRAEVIIPPHAADLFDGTVADNVHPDEQRALTALHTAACDDIPHGPHRQVGENGRMLSGGQRQRVALARALATDTDFLILLDPTTAVDSITEHRIATRVRESRQGKTTVVFSSAPAWRAVADRIVDSAKEVGL